MIETRPLKTVWEMPSPPKEQWCELGWRPTPHEKEWASIGAVLRPHILYGPMVANFISGRWLVGGGNMWFPEDAFEPYWMSVPTMPWREKP